MHVDLVRAGAAAAAAALVSGCVVAAAPGPAPGRAGAPPEEDRQAILAMAGEYDVTFNFRETIPIAPGYDLHEPHVSHADEVIRVLADEGGFISLQHLLVVSVGDGEDPVVVKHWRQDWVYEPAHVLAFEGRGTWDMRPVGGGAADGAWSQTVYQVDDSPRYAGVGRWSHDGGASTWESNVIWRPLPRRDDTTRTDYHVMECVNRHTITSWGWAHEEDNFKVALTESGPQQIVREIGTNTYVSADVEADYAADAYWDATEGYWQTVRAAWSLLEADGRAFAIEDDPWGAQLYMPVLEIADQLANAEIDLATAESRALDLIRAQTSGPAAERLAAAQ